MKNLVSGMALDELNEYSSLDFRLVCFDRGRLAIAGSPDLCYYHVVEAQFTEVSLISCPTDFCNARFRIGTTTELDGVSRLVEINDGCLVFAIDAESSASIERQTFLIVARSLTVKRGTVYYYQRENLKPGERILIPTKGLIS
jgi:hypothetical protein